MAKRLISTKGGLGRITLTVAKAVFNALMTGYGLFLIFHFILIIDCFSFETWLVIVISETFYLVITIKYSVGTCLNKGVWEFLKGFFV